MLASFSRRTLLVESTEAPERNTLRRKQMTTTYIAWTGTDGKLNVQSLPAGQPTTLNQTSNQGPALASYNNLIYLAWTGTNGRLNVIFSADGKNWVNQVTLGQTSKLAPASALGPFQVEALVWTGANGILN